MVSSTQFEVVELPISLGSYTYATDEPRGAFGRLAGRSESW
jgi:hypothetical protein